VFVRKYDLFNSCRPDGVQNTRHLQRSSEQGLSRQEAQQRLTKVGFNKLRPQPVAALSNAFSAGFTMSSFMYCWLLRAAALCNNARLVNKKGDWMVHGDPTGGALNTLARKAGMAPDFLNQDIPRTDSIPFEPEHRYMATLHHDHSGHAFMFIKGAPERVLAMCNLQRIDGEDVPIHLAHWHQMMDEIAGRDQRLLAIAFKTAPATQKQISFADVESGLTLLGVAGMIDPPRPEAVKAVLKCQNAGIRVKMITGDHAATAKAIAAQINIGDGSVLNGAELDRMTDDELNAAIRNIDVFARTSPENKLRLVTALQADGHVVAMTGAQTRRRGCGDGQKGCRGRQGKQRNGAGG